MGCGVSRIDGIFFRRVQEIKNQPLLKDSSTLSKKELLLHDSDENASSFHNNASRSKPSSPDASVHRAVKPEEPMEKNLEVKTKEKDKKNENEDKKHEYVQNDHKDDEMHEIIEKESSREKGKDDGRESEFEDAWTDADNEDDDDDERKIGHGDSGNFPGSPSFRVYYKGGEEGDHEHDDIGKRDAFKDEIPRDNALSSKESSVDKKVASGRKRRSFRKVLPKGFKSCYTSPRSNPDSTHLLSEKTIA